MRKGKEFVFPENVNKDFGIWKDYTLKDFGIIFLAFLICLLFILIPPYNVFLIFGKIILVVLIMTAVLAVLTLRPVKSRKNISQLQYLRMKKKYKHSQKLYFLSERKRDKPYEVKK